MLIIRLFHKLSVEGETRSSVSFSSRKVQELLGYLLLNRGRVHAREALAEVLWGSDQNSQARKYLRKALWQLTGDLSGLGQAQALLLAQPEWLQINPQASLWLDVEVFEKAFQAVQELQACTLSDSTFHTLEDVLRLYRGDLLEGWPDDWCRFERERLREMYLLLVDKLMACCESRGLFDKGIAYGHILLACDRAQERCHQRLMRLYYFAENRTAALRQFETCRAALAEELDVAPSKRTLELYQRIARDELEVEPTTPPIVDPAPISDEPLQRVHQLLALEYET